MIEYDDSILLNAIEEFNNRKLKIEEEFTIKNKSISSKKVSNKLEKFYTLSFLSGKRKNEINENKTIFIDSIKDILKNKKISSRFISENIKYLKEYDLVWDLLIRYQDLTKDFIAKNIKKFKLDDILNSEKFSIIEINLHLYKNNLILHLGLDYFFTLFFDNILKTSKLNTDDLESFMNYIVEDKYLNIAVKRNNLFKNFLIKQNFNKEILLKYEDFLTPHYSQLLKNENIDESIKTKIRLLNL
ncbi:hypothetical protein Bp8pS_236 [Bacillus phage vB_BpuM-BpSp]|nr:hypothetical protein Bp8pS_236 [Bacillus phage vB_BpuM-BpSp]